MFTRALPSCFTVGNLFLGIVSIILAIQNSWPYAAFMVILGMLLDGLDGRVARMLNKESEFGKELDSLSDVISFGVAPAVIMFLSVFKDLGPEAWLVTAIFPICGALRLARYNVHPGDPNFFSGLPITAAGGILATMALYKEHVSSPYFLMLGMLFLSFLMVSNIQYPKFKKVSVSKVTFWIAPFFVVIIAISAIFFPAKLPQIMFIPLVLYALYGIKKTLEARGEGDEEEPVNEVK